MDPLLINLGIKLAELTAKNTASFISTKMEEAKNKKTLEDQAIAYSQIINNLLADKLELERVAREYKELYEKVTISDEDIEYLQKTLENVVSLLSSSVPKLDDNKESIDILINLLNKDTLKTMQLLGFNFKEAIGEPLTELSANTIKSKLKSSASNRNNNKRN